MANPNLPIGALQKPRAGSFVLERHAKRQARIAKETAVMREAKKRDKTCRFPHCECKGKLQLHACHRIHRGMGGDPSGDRTTRETLITFCWPKHRLWDSGGFDIVPQDRVLGFDGCVDFLRPDARGRWEVFASEKRIGISTAVGR